MALYLIRHGETEANARRVLQVPGVPLSERGQDQARRLGARLIDEGIRHILASDYARAAMTAQAISAAAGVPVDHEPLLQERNFGDLRGSAYADLDSDPFAPGYEPPGGESWDAFHARTDVAFAAVERYAARASGHVAVVTHGLVCRAFVARNLGVGEDAVPAGWVNTSLTIIDGPPWKLRLLNCSAHLESPTQTGPA